MNMGLKNQQGVTTFWGISIILMEVVVVLFVFYIIYFFWIENPTPTSNILIIRTFKGDVVSVPKNLDTAGWLSFSSDNLNFSLQYPSDYKIFNDEIVYGSYQGTHFSLERDGQEIFSLRVFPLEEEEKSKDVSVAQVFERLVGIDTSVYQSYVEKVAGKDAIVYRQVPGTPAKDHIYFMSSNNFFESVFDEFSAKVLSTFKLVE